MGPITKLIIGVVILAVLATAFVLVSDPSHSPSAGGSGQHEDLRGFKIP